jgi:DNA-binding Xre family transcriptional regulator
MIKNEKQYKITRKKLQDIQEEINRLKNGREHLPAKDELLLVSLLMMKQQMEDEIAKYDLVKTMTSAILGERSIDDLPTLLIEYKIQSGMTQKEFSEKIGMKEQQLQRYEAENFNSISFKNLLKIIHAIGLNVTVKGTIPGEESINCLN